MPVFGVGADSPRAHANNGKMGECATKSKSATPVEPAGGLANGEHADVKEDEAEDEDEEEEYLALEELLECELCGAQLDSKSELAIHRRLRHGLCAATASNGSHASNAPAPAASAGSNANGARFSFPGGHLQRL